MRVLLTEPENWSSEGIAALGALGDLRARSVSGEELARELPRTDVLCIRLRTRVDRKLLTPVSCLKVVVTPTTGLDHLDLTALEDQRIDIISLKGEREFLERVTATAEHAFALLLAVSRRLPAAHASAVSGRWAQAGFRGRTLAGKRLGIVGFGRLGSMMARMGSGFGMRVHVYDPFQSVSSEYVACQSIGDLASVSDVLSIHALLNAGTRNLVDREVFARLPQGAVLINTARGAIVDEDALLEALRTGQLAGAGLDVLCDEHRIGRDENKVLEYARDHPHVVVTPHISGQTVESVRDADLFIVDQLKKWMEGHGR